MRPRTSSSRSQFRSAPPPEYLSPAFNGDVAEVLTIRTNLTPAQLAIALGWAYGAGTYTPVGFWNELAATYVAAGGLDEAAAANVFGLMSADVFDSLIAAFDAKYHYWTLRPHQENPAITTAFPVPNYPAYPSGHGSVSGASARVLAHFFPSRRAELAALVDEAAPSRINAGIHFRFDHMPEGEATGSFDELPGSTALSAGVTLGSRPALYGTAAAGALTIAWLVAFLAAAGPGT